ncbi:MAG: ROK family protein [Bacteroidota bacterium]
MELLGIDIGGSGIKGAMVDIETGQLTTDRHRIDTPQPATPQAVAGVVKELVEHFKWKGPVGCGLPSVVLHGVAQTASNIDEGWIGTNAEALLHAETGLPFKVVNDADAAGLAEAAFGGGRNQHGLIMVLTIGTGIGSAIIADGKLIPNTELGHLRFKGGIAEKYAADSIRKKEGLPWEEWAVRLDEYLNHVYKLFYPDMLILGGGVSKKFERYQHKLDVPCPIQPAELLNQAGIIGAALAAQTHVKVV